MKNSICTVIGIFLLGCSHSTGVLQSRLDISSSSKTIIEGSNKNLDLNSINLVEQSTDGEEPKRRKGTKTKLKNSEGDKKDNTIVKPALKKTPLDELKVSEKPKEKSTQSGENKLTSKQKNSEEENKKSSPLLTDEKANLQQREEWLVFYEFYAPEKYKHPLRNSKKLTFMIGEDSKGSYLYGEGPIISGAYEKFLRYVEHYKSLGVNLDRLMLHSPGGVLNEGIKIGEYLLNNHWATDADRYMKCYSTCGFIYMAGLGKRIQTGAEVGFHRPYLPQVEDTPKFIEQVYNEYQSYWRAVGGSPELYNTFMRGYGRDDMYILNSENIGNYMTLERY